MKVFVLAKCFIIEKDRKSIEMIQHLLTEFDDLDFLGASDHGDFSMNVILKEHPKLVFLNIDDVILDSFRFKMEIDQYSSSSPIFIAISSTKNNSYEVIKNDFFDILVKPFSELEVRKSILRFRKRFPIKEDKIICLKSYKDFHYINTDEIQFLKADNNTTDFIMKDGSVVNAFKTLKTFEGVLPRSFLRIHRSYIINSKYVSRIQYGKNLCVIANNEFKIPFTKVFLDNIMLINDNLSRASCLSIN